MVNLSGNFRRVKQGGGSCPSDNFVLALIRPTCIVRLCQKKEPLEGKRVSKLIINESGSRCSSMRPMQADPSTPGEYTMVGKG